jgi:hypothetical protein
MYKFVEYFSPEIEGQNGGPVPDEVTVDNWQSALNATFIMNAVGYFSFRHFAIKYFDPADVNPTKASLVGIFGLDNEIRTIATVSALGDQPLAALGLPVITDLPVLTTEETPVKPFRVIQHLPSFVDRTEPSVDVYVDSWAEIEVLPFVADWKTDGFNRFSLWRHDDISHLMAEMKNGKFFVVARIEAAAHDFDLLDLPTWVEPKTVFEFREGGQGIPETMLQKFQFSTREELFDHPFIKDWTSKPDFVELAFENRRDEDNSAYLRLISVVQVGHWWLGSVRVVDAAGKTNPFESLRLRDFKTADERKPEVVLDLNDIPGVTTVDPSKFQTKTTSNAPVTEARRLYQEYLDQGMCYTEAFRKVVATHSDPGSDFEELRELAESLAGWPDLNSDEVEFTPTQYINMARNTPLEGRYKVGGVFEAEQFLQEDPGRFVALCKHYRYDVLVDGVAAVVSKHGEGAQLIQHGAWAYIRPQLDDAAGILRVTTPDEFNNEFVRLEEVIWELNDRPVKRVINLTLDPEDKDPHGTVAFLLKEAGFTPPEPDELEEGSEHEKEQALLHFQSVFTSPETSWDDLIEAAQAARDLGAYTPGQFIEADGTDLFDEPGTTADSLVANAVRPKGPSVASQLKEFVDGPGQELGFQPGAVSAEPETEVASYGRGQTPHFQHLEASQTDAPSSEDQSKE